LEAKSIELDFMRGTRGAQAFGDRVLLQQLFVNLILNSIQAISGAQGANRKIRISTNADSTARMVVVEIHDSGQGIPDEIANRIFESFFTTKGDGLGIGLSLCHSIVSAHEGWLTAHNHDEGGAIFRIRLPYIGAGAAAMAPSP
jgi:signal transduction histidine kinase